ncbi:hypothetical protein TNCV_1158101 [Trichonephila clavipes]|nr:hypothetical protein TNCV_1158101 [Trichonephila clavipes]
MTIGDYGRLVVMVTQICGRLIESRVQILKPTKKICYVEGLILIKFVMDRSPHFDVLWNFGENSARSGGRPRLLTTVQKAGIRRQ